MIFYLWSVLLFALYLRTVIVGYKPGTTYVNGMAWNDSEVQEPANLTSLKIGFER